MVKLTKEDYEELSYYGCVPIWRVVRWAKIFSTKKQVIEQCEMFVDHSKNSIWKKL